MTTAKTITDKQIRELRKGEDSVSPAKLSRPQIDALRYARSRQLYAADINDGDGNMRRTLLWLIKHGLLGWDPIYSGRVVLTKLGEQKLTESREAKP
jgi:hypothetical protein